MQDQLQTRDRLIQEEKRTLNTAGASSWKEDILEGRDSIALVKLENLIEEELANQEDPSQQHLYFAGVLHTYAKGGSNQKSIDRLESAGDYKSSKINFYKIIAYTKNNALSKAKSLLKEQPKLKDQLPKIFRLY